MKSEIKTETCISQIHNCLYILPVQHKHHKCALLEEKKQLNMTYFGTFYLEQRFSFSCFFYVPIYIPATVIANIWLVDLFLYDGI